MRLATSNTLEWLGSWGAGESVHGRPAARRRLSRRSIWGYRVHRDAETRTKVRWMVFGALLSGDRGPLSVGYPRSDCWASADQRQRAGAAHPSASRSRLPSPFCATASLISTRSSTARWSMAASQVSSSPLCRDRDRAGRAASGAGQSADRARRHRSHRRALPAATIGTPAHWSTGCSLASGTIPTRCSRGLAEALRRRSLPRWCCQPSWRRWRRRSNYLPRSSRCARAITPG